jgi:Putative zinc-finger
MSDDRYSDWDASYLIGALSADERREYERHLTECAACRGQVAELAGLPGLLAAVPTAQVLVGSAASDSLGDSLGDPLSDSAGETSRTGGAAAGTPALSEPRMPPTSLPRLLTAAKRQRRRSRALVVGVVTVAAGLAASLALVLPGWTGSAPSVPAPIASQPTPAAPQSDAIVLEQVVPSPLSANVTLADHDWGTRIDSRCAYADTRYPSGAQAYALYVTDRQGAQREVATWQAGPGSTVEAVGTTWLRARDIAAVDIRSVSTGAVLLKSMLNAE